MDPLFADFRSLSSMTREKADKNIQEALNYLRLDFRNLGIIIGQYHPLEVLKMAAWESRRISRTKAKEPIAAATGRLLPVLLQSIVQSTFYDASHISGSRDIKEKDWQRIRTLADDVTKRLLRSIESYAVLMVRTGRIDESNAELYRTTLFEEAFPPEEDVDRIEKLSYLTYASMQSSSEIINERYGASPEVLIDGMYKVIRRGLEGIDRLSEEASIYKAEVETLIAQKRAADPTRIVSEEDLIHEIIRENGWEMRVKRLAGERDDFDLFRPEFAANLPSKTYQALSAAPGTLDIDKMMLKGLWPATVYPFLRFGDMYFSFVSEHIQSYSLRILQETAGLPLQYTEATLEALRQIFTETDDESVYSFDGNKVDVQILSSLVEVNAFTSPDLFQSRIVRRAEEMNRKPSIGHKELFVEPDDFEDLHQISDGIFSSSSYFLIRSASIPEKRTSFYRAVFGQLEMPEPTEFDAIIDPDEVEKEIPEDDDVLSDSITDEYEYEVEDEDEKEREIEEREKALEEEIPEDRLDYEKSVELEKLADKYALTSDIIRRDEEAEAEADEYEKELDDDDFLYDDDSEDHDEIHDDVDPEAEKIYDEAEKEDTYSDESYSDPDQLTFLDDLLSDDGEEDEVSRLADEELASEDEEEFERSEKEAEAFLESSQSAIPAASIQQASDADEADNPPEAEMDDFPCFSEMKEEPSSPETEHSPAEPPADEVLPDEQGELLSESDEIVVDSEVPASPLEESPETEPVQENAEDEKEAPDDDIQPETTESLIDKGLVKPVELAGGGRVFVMTEAPVPETEARTEKRLPGILEAIASRLDGKSAFREFLSEAEDDVIDYLGGVIRSSWEKQVSDGKDKLFSIYDYSISVIIAANKVNDELRREELLNNAGAVMYSRHKEQWNALIISINDDFELIDAYEKVISPSSFSVSNWKICRMIGEQLIARGR